jgi:hypothetical protein
MLPKKSSDMPRNGAAALKYFRDVMKKRHPGADEC